MSQRFHFDLTNGENFIRDEEGVDASDVAEAIKEAETVLAEMRNNDEAAVSAEGWQLIIRDARGATVKAIPLDEAAAH